MKCQICNVEMKLYFQAEYNRTGLKDFPFQEHQCPECKLLATYPPPTNLTYPGSIGTSGEVDVHHKDITEENAPHWYLRLLENLKKEKDSGHILDLGANSGDFTVLMENNGFKVTAVEIDEDAVAKGRELGRNIIQGDAFTMDFPEKFDAIIMNHVLEHIPDLKDVSTNLSRLLKEDGVIFVNIPYYKGFFPRLMKENWGLWTPNTHVTFFTRKSIEKLFKANFQSISMKTNTTCEPLGEFSIKRPKEFIKNLMAKLAEIFSLGDELRVVLKKPLK